MEDADDMQIDPAMAAAMGFSGFGTQTHNKKRKHGAEDAFVSVDNPTQAASGANTTVVGSRKGEKAPITGAQEHSVSAGGSPAAASMTGPDGKPTLEALRHGLRNAQGDMVYFLPSFIEDPWKDLKSRKL